MKRVVLGQFSDQDQAMRTLSALHDYDKVMGRKTKLRMVATYQVVARDGGINSRRSPSKSVIRCPYCKREDFPSLQARAVHVTVTHRKKKRE